MNLPPLAVREAKGSLSTFSLERSEMLRGIEIRDWDRDAKSENPGFETGTQNSKIRDRGLEPRLRFARRRISTLGD